MFLISYWNLVEVSKFELVDSFSSAQLRVSGL